MIWSRLRSMEWRLLWCCCRQRVSYNYSIGQEIGGGGGGVWKGQHNMFTVTLSVLHLQRDGQTRYNFPPAPLLEHLLNAKTERTLWEPVFAKSHSHSPSPCDRSLADYRPTTSIEVVANPLSPWLLAELLALWQSHKQSGWFSWFL